MVRGGERPPCGWGCLLILRINIKKWSMLGGGVYQIGMPVCVCVCVCVCACVCMCVCVRTIYVRLARTAYMYTPYVTVYLVISLPNMPYIHRMYINMVLANPRYTE
jgi:hypothetical protein